MKDSKIFELFKPTENDKLSDLKGYDLQDLIYYLNDLYLTLRTTLGLDKSVTFGMELEFEKSKNVLINTELSLSNLNEDFKIKHDGSLGVFSGEIATPILKDFEVDWEKLEKVCKIVSRHATIVEKAGGHIHVGAHILGREKDSILNFLKLWAVYENIIFRFCYGEFLSGRDGISRYAYSMKDKFEEVEMMCRKDDDLTSYDVVRRVARDKYQAVNFCHVHNLLEEQERNTIEFRCPNGTLNPVIWQNNLNLFVKLIEYAKSKEFNDDIINKRRTLNFEVPHQVSDYNKIFLKQALELTDMIFNNNLDKMYFLKQYLKKYQYTNQPLAKAKKFTKPFTKTFK